MVCHLGLGTHSMMTPHRLLYDHFYSCCNLLYLVMVSLFCFYCTLMFLTFWGKSGGYILRKMFISLFVEAWLLKRFEFVCILLRWRPSHCCLTDGVEFLKQWMPSRLWQEMRAEVASIVCVAGLQFSMGTLQAALPQVEMQWGQPLPPYQPPANQGP
jgi:hypothetical protein